MALLFLFLMKLIDRYPSTTAIKKHLKTKYEYIGTNIIMSIWKKHTCYYNINIYNNIILDTYIVFSYLYSEIAKFCLAVHYVLYCSYRIPKSCRKAVDLWHRQKCLVVNGRGLKQFFFNDELNQPSRHENYTLVKYMCNKSTNI